MSWRNLLLDDGGIIIRKKLAVKVGVTEAVALQQLYYVMTTYPDRVVEIDGRKWVKAGLSFWQEQIPFFSEATIRRGFAGLRDRKVILTERGREASVYTIDFAVLDALDSDQSERSGVSDCADETGQSDLSGVSDCAEQSDQNERAPCIREPTTEPLAATSAASGDGDAPSLPGLEPPPPPIQPTPPADTRVEEVFAYYVMVFGDRLRVKTLTDPRSRTIRKALAAVDGDVDLLKRAIDGLKSYRDTHPDGSNDISLSVIFATGPQDRSNLTEKIEWWAGHSEDKADIPSSVPSALRGRVLELAVTVLKREQQPDSEAVAERAIQAEAALASRFKLKVVSDGSGKLLRWEVVA